MDAEFNQDGMDQGYARVILTFDEGDQPYTPGDSIAIGRLIGSDNWEFIGRNGDGAKTSAPEPLKFKTKPVSEDGSVTFELQPAYVDLLEDGPYTVKLLGPDGTEKDEGGFYVDNLVLSGLDSTGTLKDYTEEEADLDRKKAEELARREAQEAEKRVREQARNAAASAAAAAAAAARKTPEASAEETRRILDHEEVIRQNADTEAEREFVENEAISERQEAMRTQEARAQMDLAAPELDQPPRKSKMGLIAGAIIVLLALGGGFYVWHSQNQAREAERLAAEAQAKMEAQQKAARADAKGRVAAFFAGKRTPEGAMRLANDLDADTPEQKDALFRLYYYAAENGSPEGAMRYAECVDPSRPEWGTAQKDGVEAWDNYGKAPDGAKAREELKKWTEKAAAGGDAKAAQWLSHME